MTTELEKQFFDTFGIEPKTGIGLVKFQEPHYPTITDRHYLELIMIVLDYCYEDNIDSFDIYNLSNFKADILEFLIILVRPNNFHELVYKKVQELFKGE